MILNTQQDGIDGYDIGIGNGRQYVLGSDLEFYSRAAEGAEKCNWVHEPDLTRIATMLNKLLAEHLARNVMNSMFGPSIDKAE